MKRAEHETTAPIDREQLLGLLDSMTPVASAPPKRPAATSTSRHFMHLAARLPSIEPIRRPRATRPPPLPRPRKTAAAEIAGPAEQKAAQTVADVLARLDTGEESAVPQAISCEPPAAPLLSREVVSQLSGEEIAMLPIQYRLAPEVSFRNLPPAHGTRLAPVVVRRRVPPIVWRFVSACIFGLAAAYVLS
jgi:hypothetical protein